MKKPRVLISGASIGGPALAFWLHRYGFDVTVVEKAPDVRAGGQAVDFKGPVHHTVLAEMGILDAVREASVPNADGMMVNARGRKIATAPGAFAGGEINIPRGDLARILYDLTSTSCEYLFGHSITSLTETDSGVDVTFLHAASQTFDLVFGADGIHSNVRKLAFGPESDYVRHLGYYYVLAELDARGDEVMYNEPGRMAALGGEKAPAFFVFASPLLPPTRDDVEAQKQQVIEAYRGRVLAVAGADGEAAGVGGVLSGLDQPRHHRPLFPRSGRARRRLRLRQRARRVRHRSGSGRCLRTGR